jgi:hypothetical protein
MLVVLDGMPSIPMGIAAHRHRRFRFWVHRRWLWGWHPLRSSRLGVKKRRYFYFE